MEWSVISALSELVGAIVVVVTLLYVARQIQQNTESMRAASSTSYREGNIAFSTIVAQSDEAADIWRRGRQDLDSLSEVHAERFGHLFATWITYLQQLEELEAVGVLSAELAHTRDMQLQWIMDNPGLTAQAKIWLDMYPPRFRKRMERLFEDSRAC